MGAKQATGELLLFLNPDTKVKKGAINILVQELISNEAVGMVAPQLVDSKGRAYLSTTKQPNSKTAFIAYSFFDTWFPNNLSSRDYWYKDFSLEEKRVVESVSGAAMITIVNTYSAFLSSSRGLVAPFHPGGVRAGHPR